VKSQAASFVGQHSLNSVEVDCVIRVKYSEAQVVVFNHLWQSAIAPLSFITIDNFLIDPRVQPVIRFPNPQTRASARAR